MRHQESSGAAGLSDFRDLPGWDALVTAGQVPPTRPEVLAAAREAVAAAVRADAPAVGAAGATAPRAQAADVRPGGADEPGGARRARVPAGRPRVIGRLRATGRRPFAFRLLLAGAAAATAAVVIVSGVTGGHAPAGRDTRPDARADAALFLTQVADVQEAHPAAAAGQARAPYWGITKRRTAASGSVTTVGEYLAHRAGRTSYLGDKQAPGPGRFSIGTRNLTWDELGRLPTTPAALSALLERYADPGPDPSEGIYATIGDLLVAPASPQVRTALYRVAAALPGVRLLGAAVDGEGRAGTAVERGDGTVTVRYVIDSTGRLLETDVATVHALPALPASGAPRSLADLHGVSRGRDLDGSRPAVPAGAVVERTVYTAVGPVDSPGAHRG